MSLGRRKVRLEDESAWVFNRMVDAYESRPPYPQALLNALSSLVSQSEARVADVGAGIGHLALPLAARGLKVTALEPAIAMLERLKLRAQQHELELATVHASAESMPLPDAGFELVVISDAVHFLDSDRASYEVRRILAPGGALAVILCEFTPTPFMRAVTRVMQEAAPRRPREVSSSVTQLLAVPKVRATKTVFKDETPVGPDTLEGILRSISFIGPAMNPQRYAAFRQRIHAIEHEPVWARSFTLYAGFRAD